MGGSAATSRTILSVIGPHSGSGKTVFVTRLLRCLGGGLGCLKVRPLHRRHDARTPADQAGAGRYFMEDSADLDRVGMDTEQYLQAGAKQVEILRHEGAGLDPGLQHALDLFPIDTPIIVESSSAVRLLRPVAVILIVRPPPKEMKPSTETVLPLVSDLLINAPTSLAATEADRLVREYPTLRPRFTWLADLATAPPPPAMVARLRAAIAGSSSGASA